MRNIFKMDIHRLLHSKVFYVSLAFLIVAVVSMPLSGLGTSMEMLMGVGGSIGAEAGDDFMQSMLGTSIVFILIGIIQTLFICGDYSGGFCKNIFTAHADAKGYIGGKMLSMSVASGIMLVFYTVVALLALAISGNGIVLSGGVFGLLAFLVQKWLLSCAFNAVLLLVNLISRNTAVGVIASFLVATGGLTMGLAMFGEMLGIGWISQIGKVMISGASQLCTLMFSGATCINVLLVSAVWICACFFGSKRVLATKDV